MRLILTEYIATLKEEGELDVLIQDLLREYDFEIVFGPKKGERQYGVDIYAVGSDPDDNVRKVFLVTVKQGNLDRNNWQGSIQAIQPSLQEIVSVFVRNNLAPEHTNLPIKIIVAHNGINVSAIQQNWKGFADTYPQYQFAIWQRETLVNMVEEKLVSEFMFSDASRTKLRKIIIYLFNPDYDFQDLKELLDELFGSCKLERAAKKQNLKQVRKINLLLAIIISYCKKEDDHRLALKAAELTLLRMWRFFHENESLIDEDFMKELIHLFLLKRDVTFEYLHKIAPVSAVRDGFSKDCSDAITYGFIAYEHIGFVAIAGLELIQMAEYFTSTNAELAALLHEHALSCAVIIIQIFNHNRIVFTPRADNQSIEINLSFLLLFKVGRVDDIKTLLREFNNQIGNAKTLLNIAPHFTNNIDEIFELGVNYEKLKDFDYQSSILLTVLAEWTLVVDDKNLYQSYVALKKEAFPSLDLLLWFPDGETEKQLYTKRALPSTGYTLSNIVMPEDFDQFKELTLREFVFNCSEVDYSFIKHHFWTIGLIACRYFRTYVFPYYWRTLMQNACDFLPKPTTIAPTN